MEQDSLFSIQEDTRPLADRMRPETLDEYVGQKQLVAKGNLLWQMIEHDDFLGPTRCWKNDIGTYYCTSDKELFCGFLSCYEWYKRN